MYMLVLIAEGYDGTRGVALDMCNAVALWRCGFRDVN